MKKPVPVTITATVDGRTHEIPQAWLMGFTLMNGSYEDAIRHWHEQTILQEGA